MPIGRIKIFSTGQVVVETAAFGCTSGFVISAQDTASLQLSALQNGDTVRFEYSARPSLYDKFLQAQRDETSFDCTSEKDVMNSANIRINGDSYLQSLPELTRIELMDTTPSEREKRSQEQIEASKRIKQKEQEDTEDADRKFKQHKTGIGRSLTDERWSK